VSVDIHPLAGLAPLLADEVLDKSLESVELVGVETAGSADKSTSETVYDPLTVMLSLLTPVTTPRHELAAPEWTPIFDSDPAGAMNWRKAILNRVATEGIMAMGYHFPFPGVRHVVKHGKAYRWEAVYPAW
jgi:hypothetical protein